MHRRKHFFQLPFHGPRVQNSTIIMLKHSCVTEVVYKKGPQDRERVLKTLDP